jgi:hypothetical protein
MLAREAFVSLTPELDLGFSGHTETIARIGHFRPHVVKRHGGFSAVLGCVARGYGIAVVPELMKTMNVANVVFRDIAANPMPLTSIAFVYGSDPSPSARLLIQHMQRHARRNGGKGPSPPQNRERITIPKTLKLDRHPEVAARSAALGGCGSVASAVALRGSLCEHLRATGMSQ